jgi:hypothetical protein
MLQTGNESFDTLSNSELIERLTSGTVWVSRGAGYRVDFVVSENGQPLLDHDVSEKIGRYLQAAPVRLFNYGIETYADGYSYGVNYRWMSSSICQK